MNPELFPIPESLSPKLAWLKKHGLVTHYFEVLQEGAESPETGEELYPWTCMDRRPNPNHSIKEGIVGVGETEEEACMDYARKNDILHWTLEP